MVSNALSSLMKVPPIILFNLSTFYWTTFSKSPTFAPLIDWLIGVFMRVGACKSHSVVIREQFVGSLHPSFHHEGSGAQTQVSRLGGKQVPVPAEPPFYLSVVTYCL